MSETIQIQSFSDVCQHWPGGRDKLADDLGIKLGRVKKWCARDTIPSEFWLRVSAAAQRINYPVTLELLATIAARRLR